MEVIVGIGKGPTPQLKLCGPPCTPSRLGLNGGIPCAHGPPAPGTAVLTGCAAQASTSTASSSSTASGEGGQERIVSGALRGRPCVLPAPELSAPGSGRSPSAGEP
jgi:hypothetical protein